MAFCRLQQPALRAPCATIECMKIAGLQKLTLLDYPGKTAATIFTPGCNFRCPFCHNADLVALAADVGADDATTASASASAGDASTPAEGLPSIPEDELFAFLGKRHGLLDGVCVTGGEPTLQPDLAQFCARVKREGFAVKLDTNGTRPEALHALLDAGLVDMVAMDVKNAPARYAETVGLPKDALRLDNVEASMRALLESPVPFEFRTTVVRELHAEDDLLAAARWIAHLAREAGRDAADVPWFLQGFVDSESVLAGKGAFSPWDKNALRGILPALQAILPQTALRGVNA